MSSGKRRIRLRDVVSQVQNGQSESDLREMLGLSTEGVKKVFEHLTDAGFLREPENLFEDTNAEGPYCSLRSRQSQREKLAFPLPVQDVSDPQRKLIIRDVSSNGFRTAGCEYSVGQKAAFLVLADVFEVLDTILVEAECRWARQKGGTRPYHVAGFAITEISAEGKQIWQKLIDVVRTINRGISPRRLGLKGQYAERLSHVSDNGGKEEPSLGAPWSTPGGAGG